MADFLRDDVRLFGVDLFGGVLLTFTGVVLGVFSTSRVFSLLALTETDFVGLPLPKYSDVVVTSPSGVSSRFLTGAFLRAAFLGLYHGQWSCRQATMFNLQFFLVTIF